MNFALVGGIGFLVDAGLTEALVALGVGPYLARVLAVSIAIAVTYGLNRRFTFKSADASERDHRQKVAYLAVSLASIALNYTVYAATMATVTGVRPVLAVALGSGVAMFTNYFGYSRLVFRPKANSGQAEKRPASAP